MKLKLLAMLGLSAAALSSAAPAQQAAMPEDVKINQLIIYGDQPCPPSTEEEIVICEKRSADDQFRIPENLRDSPNAGNDTWTQRAEELQVVGREGIASCSPTGPGGMTGCLNQLIQQARAERATGDEVNWTRLVEQARQERLSRIDAEAEAVEQQLRDRD